MKRLMQELNVRKGIVEIKLLLGKSWEIVGKVPRPLAWVFVDGCHCQECVTKDIKAYAPLIAPDGFFLFHDVGTHYQQMAPSEWYHGEGRKDEKGKRRVGVLEAIQATEVEYLADYDLVEESPCKQLVRDGKIKWFGGMRVYQRRRL